MSEDLVCRDCGHEFSEREMEIVAIRLNKGTYGVEDETPCPKCGHVVSLRAKEVK